MQSSGLDRWSFLPAERGEPAGERSQASSERACGFTDVQVNEKRQTNERRETRERREEEEMGGGERDEGLEGKGKLWLIC